METETPSSETAHLEHDLLTDAEASPSAPEFALSPRPGTDLVVVDIQRLAGGMLVALVMHLLQRAGPGEEPDRDRDRHVALPAWRLQRMTAFADAHLHEKLCIGALACAAGLSTRHFTRAFRQEVGDTPHHWLMNRRIEKAKLRLADSDDTLEQIARTCGFSAQSHFTRVFRLVTGEPPKRWRQLHKRS